MEWSYTDRVSLERQKKLLAAPDFDVIAGRIVAEMLVISFDTCRGKLGKVRGCRRPYFALKVSKETFDLFYNSPRGYRAQYHKSPKEGEKANGKLIALMLEKLVDYARGKTTKYPMTVEEIRLSLEGYSAKTWINEQGARKQRGDLNLVVDLEVEPWLSTAKSFIANPDRYRDHPNEEIKAVDGVKAPTGTVLEVKGAFIDENGEEHIPEDKKDRSGQIHLYGYT